MIGSPSRGRPTPPPRPCSCTHSAARAARRRSRTTSTGCWSPRKLTRTALGVSRLGGDVDIFTYRTTTTYGPGQGGPSPPVLLVGDMLDDVTYDNRFLVTEVRVNSAEEFVESLGPPIDVGPKYRAELNGWPGAGTTLLDELNRRLDDHLKPAAVTVESAPIGTTPRWFLSDSGNGKVYTIEDRGASLNVGLLEWSRGVFSLRDGKVELPFGPPRVPGPKPHQGEAAYIPLIARRVPARPKLIFEGVADAAARAPAATDRRRGDPDRRGLDPQGEPLRRARRLCLRGRPPGVDLGLR